jgi:ATP-dependent Clp protease ATP-binding subunit ClpC
MEIVERYGHNRVDSEHLLLALVERPSNPMPKLLNSLQVDHNTLIDRLIFTLKASPRTGVTDGMGDRLKFTQKTRHIIEQAGLEADLLGDQSISTVHLLLAMFSEHDTPAAKILETSGLNREGILKALKQCRPGDTKEWDEYGDGS